MGLCLDTANSLGALAPPDELFGRALENFIYMELASLSSYSRVPYSVCYWHTASGLEVDFILADGETALWTKGAPLVHSGHLGGLQAFREEHRPWRGIIVSLDPRARRLENGIEVLPWRDFLQQLWGGALLAGAC